MIDGYVKGEHYERGDTSKNHKSSWVAVYIGVHIFVS